MDMAMLLIAKMMSGGRPVAVVVVVVVFRDLAGSGMVRVNSVPDIFFLKPG